MAKTSGVPIVIVVPKADELRALQCQFEKKFGHSSGVVAGEVEYYKFKEKIKVGGQSLSIDIAVVFLNGQGNAYAAVLTSQAIIKFNPYLIFLLGTAVGRRGYVEIGDVVASKGILDLLESRVARRLTYRPKYYEIERRVDTDITTFVDSKLDRENWARELLSVPRALYRTDKATKGLWKNPPKPEIKIIASSDKLLLSQKALSEMWGKNDQVLCADMESAGFRWACGLHKKNWLVVRGISDFGTSRSKREGYRIAATLSASYLLRGFIQRGLNECRPPLSTTSGERGLLKRLYLRRRCRVIVDPSEDLKSFLNLILQGKWDHKPLAELLDKASRLDSSYEKLIARVTILETFGYVKEMLHELKRFKYDGTKELSRKLYEAIAFEKLWWKEGENLQRAVENYRLILEDISCDSIFQRAAQFNLNVCREKMNDPKVNFAKFLNDRSIELPSGEKIWHKALVMEMILCMKTSKGFEFDNLIDKAEQAQKDSDPPGFSKTVITYYQLTGKRPTKSQELQISRNTVMSKILGSIVNRRNPTFAELRQYDSAL